MQTRSRKISEVVGEATSATPKATPTKNTKRTKTTLIEETAKVQKADALVDNILKSV